jgi:hypothetical protein
VVPQVLDRRTVSGRDRSARSAAVRPAKPDLIVDIKRIPELLGIRERDGNFVIGAATPGAAIGECEALRQAWPGRCRGPVGLKGLGRGGQPHQRPSVPPGSPPAIQICPFFCVCADRRLQTFVGLGDGMGDDCDICGVDGDPAEVEPILETVERVRLERAKFLARGGSAGVLGEVPHSIAKHRPIHVLDA